MCDSVIVRLLALYSEYARNADVDAFRFDPNRTPVYVLKNLKVWEHMARVFTVTQHEGIDPEHYVKALLDDAMRTGRTLYVAQLSSAYCVGRYTQLLSVATRKYNGNDAAGQRLSENDSGDLLIAALESGYMQWESMGCPDPVRLAKVAPKLLSTIFLASFPEVQVAYARKELPESRLTEILDGLVANEAIKKVVTAWRRARGIE